MNKEATTVLSTGRHEALAAIWDILDVRRVDVSSPALEKPAKAGVGIGIKNVRPHSGDIEFGDAAHMTPFKITNGLAYQIVKRGISSRALGPLSEFLGLGKGVVAEYLDLDRGTANRRASKDQPLPTHAAESVLRLLELDQMAADTFETETESSGWLRKPHPMLDGETPLECAKSSYGAQRVKDILLAIKYGGVV